MRTWCRAPVFLALALVCAAVSGCGDTADRSLPSRSHTSGGARVLRRERAEVLRVLKKNLSLGRDQAGVYVFSGGMYKGLCVIDFRPQGLETRAVEVVSPDGRVRFYVSTSYS